MLFNTWAFPVFLLIVFAGHFLGSRCFANRALAQVLLLVGSSIFFYGYENPQLIFLLLASVCLNGLATRFLLSPRSSSSARRVVCVVALLGNFAGIAFFKYAGLIVSLIFPNGSVSWVNSIPLPLGISFYTFEGISLIVDAYYGRKMGFDTLREDIKNGTNLLFFGRVALFMTFFPHLVAGPIVRGHDFLGQIRGKTLADIDWYYAIRKLILGFFLKMVVADNLKEATAGLIYPNFLSLSKPELILLLYGYSFQIFADFCGYSLIAMGLAALFGYRFPLNFNLPYLSRSMTEFWRRWHISLSTWLRDYLYFPLGGNRNGALRVYFNLFIVMFLGGLWHGAAWSYAIWGSAHGAFLAVERFFRNRSEIEKPSSLPISILQAFIVFNIVSFLWLLFKLPHFQDVCSYFQALAHAQWKPHPQTGFVIILFSIPVVLFHLWGAVFGHSSDQAESPSWPFKGLCENILLGVMLFLVVVNSGPAGTFIYFQF